MSRAFRKPNFLGVGAERSGTTTLFNLLRQHPDIYLPPVKQPHFFDRDERYEKGLGWYLGKFFSKAGKEKAVGEITPAYMAFDCVPERIKKTLGGDIKLIFLLRNPADRAYSHYWMHKARGIKDSSFEELVNSQRPEEVDCIKRSFYRKEVKRFLKYFPKENMLFLVFEEFIKDMPSAVSQVFSFLGVKKEVRVDYDVFKRPSWEPKLKFVNDFLESSFYKGSLLEKMARIIVPSEALRERIRTLNQRPVKKPEMKEETRKRLVKIYREDVGELEKIINRDLSLWKN